MPESTRPTHFRRATEAANAIRSRLPTGLGIDVPLIGIICGSGLGGLAETLHPEPRFSIPYTDIPHFPQSTVLGHAGVLMFGLLGSKKTPVVIMNGRMQYVDSAWGVTALNWAKVSTKATQSRKSPFPPES